jgi:predicted ribosomally synthesized peptide with nif11-like leader
MSSRAAAQFLAKVRSDEDLRNRLGPAPSPEAYLAEGASAGLEFTIDELRGVVGAEQFYKKTIDDPALYKTLTAAPDEDAVVEMARRMGYQCDVVDLKAVLLPYFTEELSDAEMERVAGGIFTSSGFPDVCKTPAPPAPYVPVPYPSGW